MKILIIGPIPVKLGGKEFGGVCTHITGLSQELYKRGHEVTLWNYKPIKAKEGKDIGVIENTYWSFFKALLYGVFHFVDFDISYLSIKHKFMFVYQVYRLKEILNNSHFDVIHIHSLTNTVSIALQHLSNHIPYVISDHGFWNQKGASTPTSNTFERIKKSIGGCSKLIYISEFARKKHNEIDFGQKEKLVKIKNPIEIHEVVYRKKEKTSEKTIFFNGLTETIRIKKLPILLEAIENDTWLKKNIRLVVISNKEGENFIKKKSYSFKIEVYGKTPWEKVIEFYKRSNLLVVPSKSDSFGLVYLEALMFGIPVVGLTDLIKEFESDLDNYVGEGFDPKVESSTDLARKITVALKAKFDAMEIHTKLKAAYCWENNIKDYEEVYKSIAR